MKKIDLYLDFDGVIWNTWPIFHKFLNEYNDQEEITKHFKNLNWEEVLKDSKPFDNTIEDIKLLQDSNLFNIHVLTNCNSQEEAIAKEKFLKDLDCHLNFIPVFNRQQKAFYIKPYNSILVDDYQLNLFPFEELGGVGIKYRKSSKDNQDFIKINNLKELIDIYPEIKNLLNINKRKTKILGYRSENIKTINNFLEQIPVEFKILVGKKLYKLYRENEIANLKKIRTNIYTKENELNIIKKRITKTGLINNYNLILYSNNDGIFIEINSFKERKINNERTNVYIEEARYCFTGNKHLKNCHESKNITVFEHNLNITDINNYEINTNKKFDNRDRLLLTNQWISDEKNVYRYPLSKSDFMMKNHYKDFSFIRGRDRQIITQNILLINNKKYILSKYSKFYENGEEATFTINSFENNLVNQKTQFKIDSTLYFKLLNNENIVLEHLNTIDIDREKVLSKQIIYKKNRIRKNKPKGR